MLKKIEVNVSSLAMEEAGVNPLVVLACYQGGRITYSKGKNLAKGIRNVSDEIDNVKRYNKYWKDVASGKYDLPYGMTKEEYSNYLKGLDKVQYGKAVKNINYDEILDIRENDKFTQWISATDIGDVSKSTAMKEQILKNIEESRIAREASGYKSFVEFESELGKGVSKASEGYSGDLMSVKDAERYSEYWRELGVGSDKTWREYKLANPESSMDDYIRLVK